MQTITIKDGKEKQLLRHHPWVFSGAIDSIANKDEVGIVKSVTHDGSFIAWGWYDPKSHIPLRLLSWKEDEEVNDKWWARTITASVLRRSFFFRDKSTPTTAFRIIFGEADMLPGLVADVYGTLIRIDISARVAWDHKDLIVSTLERLLQPAMIIVNTDPAFCAVEGLSETVLFYQNGGYFTPSKRLPPIRFREDGLLYEVVPGKGKTGKFYCGQRDNRTAIEPYCKDAVVLDGCSHTGAFTLHALRSGAAWVDLIDSSSTSLKQSLAHVHINQDADIIPKGSRERVNIIKADIFRQMRIIEKNKYDVIILDPPKLAQKKSQADKAAQDCKDLNRLAMEKIKNEGIIATFSNSEAISSEMLRTILAWSAEDAGVEIQILKTLLQAEDHPIRLSFPESEYLNGYLIRVIR